ncbi:MAG: hypothetical protein WBF99_12270 [Xanthobacteraceae bacterium]
MSILDSLPATIGSALKAVFLDAVLTRETPGEGGDPFDPPAPTVTPYSCKAIVEGYSDYFKKNGLVGAKDRKVLVLATSLAVKPEPGDLITVQNVTFSVVTVATDPATAVWEIQGRM